MSSSPTPIHPGTRIGGYVIEHVLGHGGMGDVYMARDFAQDRPVALKVLPADAVDDPQRRDRLQHEGRVLQSLRHPHICSLFEVGEDAGRVFLAMEFVEGRTLQEVAAGKPLPMDRIVEIACQLAGALETARQAGVVHRDLKGANVMVLPSGDIKILDFGLAKFAPSSEQRLMNPVSRPTDPGLIFGTAEYMSPEQALGRELDHRSDLFSFGVILYELITGALPFKGATRMELFWSILNTRPAPVSDAAPSTPPALVAIVERLLEKDAKARPETAGRVLRDLEDLRPTRADRRARFLAARRRWVARIGGSALGIAIALVLVPLVQVASWWADEARETSAINAGDVWLSTEKVYDMNAVVRGAVNPAIAWVGNDGRILYTTEQTRGRSALWLKVPGNDAPHLLAADAGQATVAGPAGDAVFFVRSGSGPGLYRTTLAGAEPARIAEGPVDRPSASRDGKTVTFVRPGPNGYSLWAVAADGGEPYQLTSVVASAVPYASPDLKRVAIQEPSGVLTCDLEDCGNQAVFPVTNLLGWTPDGGGLLHLGPPGVSNIWSIRVDDGTVHQVTRFTSEAATSVAWSANGRWLGVTRRRTLRDFDWFGLSKR